MTERTLVSFAKHHVAGEMSELTGNEDPQPMVLFRDRNGEVTIMPLFLDMNSHAQKDVLAYILTANLMIADASEAVFVSSTWMASTTKDDFAHDSRMPSERDDRIEAVVIIHMTRNSNAMHRAIIDRKKTTPTLGPWEEMPGTQLGGRFGDAIANGLNLAANLPAEMREFIAQAQASGEKERLMEPTVQMLKKVRNGG